MHDGFDDLLTVAGRMAAGDEGKWARFVAGLTGPVRRRLFEEWSWQAHGGQREPDGDWRIWLLMAGRGFGKTRAGAEWVWARVRETPGAQIALVGGSRDEVVRVMIEGPSGLLSVARADDRARWWPTAGVVRFGNDAEAFVHSAAAPEKLRGPEHHFAWCDELAKWTAQTGRGSAGKGQARGEAAWDNLQMGLRLGRRPRLIVTTTPRTTALVRRVRALDEMVETQGRTAQNVHVAAAFKQWATATYAGTRLGRQELDGKLFEEVTGALLTRKAIEASRCDARFADRSPHTDGGSWRRIVVGVDPPVSAHGDHCGIVVCGLGPDDRLYVLADCSAGGLSPEGWARAVARAAAAWGADRVVAEKNQGGDMVASVLRQVEPMLPVRLVSATRGKVARAEPVTTAFETGRAKLAGAFPELEDELAGLVVGGGYDGPARSPDRADACVWAMTELMRPAIEPGVSAL